MHSKWSHSSVKKWKVIIVIPHCVAKSPNSAGVNFCTRSLKTTTITWHLHAPVCCCGQTGKVSLYKVKGHVSGYRFDGATKEISIHLHVSNIGTTIYMLIFFVSLSGSVIILISSIESNMNTKYIKGNWKNWYQFDNRLLALSVLWPGQRKMDLNKLSDDDDIY